MDSLLTSSEAMMFLIGFLSSSLIWVGFCIMCFRKNHAQALQAAHEQYIRGFHHGKKSITLYPHAPSELDSIFSCNQ